MAIYRGAGGAGDATGDSASEALLVRDLAAQVTADAADAEAARAAAVVARIAAETAETNAETAETNAETAETNAETAQAAAASSASAASTSATNAASSASAASTSATNASNSATAASNSASAASTSATNAASSASSASASASTSTTQATNASNSASASATSATNASNSATAAATSATNASNSATAAASSATSASGSASTATTQAGIATTQATNASSSASAASTSASNAATSATNASNSASAASTSATNASNSASAAATSATNAANSATAADASADAAAISETNAAASAASINLSSIAITGGSINGTTIGASTPSTGAFTSLSDSGNLTFTGTGNRILGDFSNATVANRVMFQTSTTNGVTSISIAPNGTSAISAVSAESDSLATNGSTAQLVMVGGSDSRLVSGIRGTGSYIPLTMYTGGSERLRIDTSGQLGIGTSSPGYRLDVAAGDTTAGLGYAARLRSNSTAGAATLQFTNNAVSAQNAYITADDSQNLTLASGTGYARLWTNGSERMRIDSSGNVGIGTSSPVVPLTVNSSTTLPAGSASIIVRGESNNERIQIRASGGGGGQAVYLAASTRGSVETPTATQGGDTLGFYQFGGHNGTSFTRGAWVAGIADGTWSGSNQGSAIQFSTTPNGSTTISERMRIDASGDLLVGRTLANANDNTSGCFVSPSGVIAAQRGGGTALFLNRFTSDGSVAEFRRQGTTVGSVSVTASATAYNTSSDYRLKESIAPMTGALGVVSALKPVTYTWKTDGSSGQGFIAHELQAVVPDCVTGEKDAVDAEGKPVYQGIDTSFLVATLTASIQELKAIVDAQAERIKALENK